MMNEGLMKNSVILFAGGDGSNISEKDKSDMAYVIAVDSGLYCCSDNDIKPHILIGDMDSLDEAMLSAFSKANPDIVIKTYPSEKDYTDLELALKFVPHNLKRLVIYGGLGGRLDHTTANINLLCSFACEHKMKVIFRGIKEDIYILTDENNSMVLENEPNDIVSLIPRGDKVLGVSIDNVKYPLNKKDILRSKTLGVSNVTLANSTSISIEYGVLLVFHNLRSIHES